MSSSIEPLLVQGVVPIVAGAGAALLPMIIAGVVGFAALLLRPKELFSRCRQRPGMSLGIAFALAFIGAGIWWLMTPSNAGRQRPVAQTNGSSGSITDWREVALAIIAREKQGEAPTTAVIDQQLFAPSTNITLPVIFRSNNLRTGWDGGPAPRSLINSGSWLDPIQRERGMVLCSPVVTGKRVFFGTCIMDTNGSYGVLMSLDADTLAPVWSVPLISDADGEHEVKGVYSSPAVSADGKHVVFGQGLHPDTNCHLVCLDTQTGVQKWSYLTPLHLESSPTIAGDVVVIGCGAIEGPNHKPVSEAGYVVGVGLVDGKERWRVDIADPESSPAVVDDIAYIGSGFNGNAVCAIRLGEQVTERLLWKTAMPYPMLGAVTVAGDLIIISGGNCDAVYSDPNPAGLIVALDRATGAIRWQIDTDNTVLGAIAVHEGVGIACVLDGSVIKFEVATGEKIWKKRREMWP